MLGHGALGQYALGEANNTASGTTVSVSIIASIQIEAAGAAILAIPGTLRSAVTSSAKTSLLLAVPGALVTRVITEARATAFPLLIVNARTKIAATANAALGSLPITGAVRSAIATKARTVSAFPLSILVMATAQIKARTTPRLTVSAGLRSSIETAAQILGNASIAGAATARATLVIMARVAPTLPLSNLAFRTSAQVKARIAPSMPVLAAVVSKVAVKAASALGSLRVSVGIVSAAAIKAVAVPSLGIIGSLKAAIRTMAHALALPTLPADIHRPFTLITKIGSVLSFSSSLTTDDRTSTNSAFSGTITTPGSNLKLSDQPTED